VQSYRVAALQSHPNAQNNLGVLYARGTGVPQDYVQATKWFRRAADDGLPGAQFNLARLYTIGYGVQQSDAEAAKWFRRAAEHGSPDAQMDLGYMYARGLGVTQDWVKAYMWFALVAARAESKVDRGNAMRNQAIAARRMSAPQIAEALRRACEWCLKLQRPRSAPDG
jgi:TPR repeat protein